MNRGRNGREPKSESSGVLVYSERPEIALELLRPGRQLAHETSSRVTALSLGTEARSGTRELIACGADTVLIADDPRFDVPHARIHAAALGEAVRHASPAIVLIGATIHGVEVAARVAQRLGRACASECSSVRFQDGDLLVERGVLGRFVARQSIETRPAFATIPPRRFEAPDPDESREGQLQSLRVPIPETRSRVVRIEPREKSARRIEAADVIVAAGRGFRTKEDLRLAQELADVIGGVVAASRPLTDDLRWLPVDVKVGLSGQKVKPDLYIACGISGQVEHSVGMRDSRIVVSINSDAAAPIVEQADYVVVGDLYEILPRLTETLRRLLGNP